MLGEGVTGQSVRKALAHLGLREVSCSEADLIVTSPGIPSTAFPQVSTPIISEIEFAFRLFSDTGPRLIAVSGTNGKSTTTAMLSFLLDCPYAGNIGIPLIDFIETEVSCLVIELSSYQLEACTTFAPHVAVMLNLSPDHLARHGSFSNYKQAKANLFSRQDQSDVLFYNQDDSEVVDLVRFAPSICVPVSKTDSVAMALSSQFSGHDLLNATMAAHVAMGEGLSMETILTKMTCFQPLEHRMEYLPAIHGVTYINDSKATNHAATISAIQSLDKPVHLLLAGEDKIEISDAQWLRFLDQLPSHIASVSVSGGLHDRLKRLSANLNITLHVFRYLREAVFYVKRQARSGEIVLFSPSSTSFDEFDSFEQRGRQFKKWARL